MEEKIQWQNFELIDFFISKQYLPSLIEEAKRVLGNLKGFRLLCKKYSVSDTIRKIRLVRVVTPQIFNTKTTIK